MSPPDVDLAGKDADAGKAKNDEKKKKARGRPTTSAAAEARAGELKVRVAESLNEVADWFDSAGAEKVEATTLGDIIRRDADRIAEVIAWNAEKHALVARIAERIFGRAGPLSALRAFGPMLRHLLADALARRREAIAQAEQDAAAAERAAADAGSDLAAADAARAGV